MKLYYLGIIIGCFLGTWANDWQYFLIVILLSLIAVLIGLVFEEVSP